MNNIQWFPFVSSLGYYLDKFTFLLPFTDPHKRGEPNLRNAKVISFGMINDRGGSPWWGQIKDRLVYPLILELGDQNRDGEFRRKATTPPGRPGNPMTILVDRDGEIVPSLTYPVASQAKILFLNHDWKSFGWEFEQPAVALQFTEGRCENSKLAIFKWQSFMMRNSR